MLVHQQRRPGISSCWAIAAAAAAAPLGHEDDGAGGGLGSVCAAAVGLEWMQMRLCSLWYGLCVLILSLTITDPRCLSSYLFQGPEGAHTLLHLCLNHDNKVHLTLSCLTHSVTHTHTHTLTRTHVHTHTRTQMVTLLQACRLLLQIVIMQIINGFPWQGCSIVPITGFQLKYNMKCNVSVSMQPCFFIAGSRALGS